jgi:hypothetical protein
MQVVDFLCKFPAVQPVFAPLQTFLADEKADLAAISPLGDAIVAADSKVHGCRVNCRVSHLLKLCLLQGPAIDRAGDII